MLACNRRILLVARSTEVMPTLTSPIPPPTTLELQRLMGGGPKVFEITVGLSTEAARQKLQRDNLSAQLAGFLGKREVGFHACGVRSAHRDCGQAQISVEANHSSLPLVPEHIWGFIQNVWGADALPVAVISPTTPPLPQPIRTAPSTQRHPRGVLRLIAAALSRF
jgi:hypothetical protein